MPIKPRVMLTVYLAAVNGKLFWITEGCVIVKAQQGQEFTVDGASG